MCTISVPMIGGLIGGLQQRFSVNGASAWDLAMFGLANFDGTAPAPTADPQRCSQPFRSLDR
jgi:hypothetical protein